MYNNILSVCPSDSAYKYRPQTDILFKIEDGAFDYKGVIDNAIRHIEKIQSMRSDLWEVFVNQFRSNVDDDGRWRCEYWGKMMRGACMTYQYTQNKKLYEVLAKAVRDLMATQDDLGRIATYSVQAEFNGWDVWGRKYVMLGFQHFIDICDDEAFKKEIIECMCRHADYIISKVGYEEDGKKLLYNCSAHLKGINCCSILEPFVRLYNLTEDKKYLDFASYIVDIGGMADGDMFELVCEGKLYPYEMPVTKAYETMSCLEGLTEYYRVTNIEKYRSALINFAKKIAERDVTIIGCGGCTHELFDFSTLNQTATDYEGIMLETCVTVTWMKFCYQLLCLSGDSFFADCIELSSYNAMLGSINTDGCTVNYGFAFDSYAPIYMDTRNRMIGGHNAMENHTVHYGCCACIGAAGTALMGLSSVMQGKTGIFMNMYIPGSVKVKSPCETAFTLIIDTKYPAQSGISISVEGAKGDESFALSFRIPSWCKNPSLKVNGQDFDVIPGTYQGITRNWNDGDTIELDLEMKMELIKAPFGGIENDKGSKHLVAFKKGPVVFARDRRLGEEIDSIIDVETDENGCVEAVESDSADFTTEQEYRIYNKDGSYITVVDFQSAGKTWKDDSMMTVWCPTKNYWSFDDTKAIRFCNRTHLPCVMDDNPTLVVSDTDKYYETEWYFEKVSENKYYIKHKNGLYLTAIKEEDAEVPFIYLKEKGMANQVWELKHYAVDLYRLCLDGTDLCFSHYYRTNKFMVVDYKREWTLGSLDVANNAFVRIKNI